MDLFTLKPDGSLARLKTQLVIKTHSVTYGVDSLDTNMTSCVFDFFDCDLLFILASSSRQEHLLFYGTLDEEVVPLKGS